MLTPLKTRCAAWACSLGLVLSLCAAPAAAFHNQPNGWAGLPWGASPEAVLQAVPELKKAYKLKEIQRAAATEDVLLTAPTELLGRRMSARYVLSRKGFTALTLTWEDTRPEAYNGWKDLLDELQRLWGPPDATGPDGELIWTGDLTRAEAHRRRVASGSSLELRLTGLTLNAEAPAPTTDLPRKDKSFLDEDAVF